MLYLLQSCCSTSCCLVYGLIFNITYTVSIYVQHDTPDNLYIYSLYEIHFLLFDIMWYSKRPNILHRFKFSEKYTRSPRVLSYGFKNNKHKCKNNRENNVCKILHDNGDNTEQIPLLTRKFFDNRHIPYYKCVDDSSAHEHARQNIKLPGNMRIYRAIRDFLADFLEEIQNPGCVYHILIYSVYIELSGNIFHDDVRDKKMKNKRKDLHVNNIKTVVKMSVRSAPVIAFCRSCTHFRKQIAMTSSAPPRHCTKIVDTVHHHARHCPHLPNKIVDTVYITKCENLSSRIHFTG